MRLWAVGISGNNKAYFGTGSDDYAIWMERFNDLYEYDPATNTCKRVEDIPGLGRTQAFGFSIGDKVFVGGGSGYSSDSGIMTAYSDFFEYQARD
jgi:N-acetylneuraminic acid mutarotase